MNNSQTNDAGIRKLLFVNNAIIIPTFVENPIGNAEPLESGKARRPVLSIQQWGVVAELVWFCGHGVTVARVGVTSHGGQ